VNENHLVGRHSKEDEEIYKEFMEINNELIPHVLKTDGKTKKNLHHHQANKSSFKTRYEFCTDPGTIFFIRGLVRAF
jgi:hypothetical protein